MKIDGACHCGNIKFEAEIDPGDVGVQIWGRSALGWVMDLGSVKQVPRQP